ncbi:hypothetical protein [Microbispora sp. NPDC046933]|uniref:hypothetical protein n=1 Tax=Microbispora sp. NPDC046933 TaxID=3155618 RepID=UPI00340822EA
MDKMRGAPPLTLAALAAGSAAIHFGVMPDHFAVSPGHGVLFAVAGWVQLAWAAAVLLRPTQVVLLTGGFVNLALVVIWLVGRTAGLPLGPDAWTPDPGGAPEALAALLETVLTVAAPALVAYASVTDDAGADDALADALAPATGRDATGRAAATRGRSTRAAGPKTAGSKTAGSKNTRAGAMPVRTTGAKTTRAAAKGGRALGADAARTTSVRANAVRAGAKGAGTTGAGTTAGRAGGRRLIGMLTGGSPSAGRVGAAVVACLVAAAVCVSFTSWGTTAFDDILVARPATASPEPLAGHHHHGAPQPPAAPDAAPSGTGASGTGASSAAGTTAAAAGPLTPGAGVVAADTATSAAEALAAAVRRETAGRLPTAADAERAGYRVWTDNDGVQQLANPALLQDGLVLDPAQPEVLVYHGRKTLLGAVFVMPPGTRGPAIGSLTPWHSHTCPLCDPPRETDMLHVWLVDYPGGGFADISGPALQAAVAKLPPAS